MKEQQSAHGGKRSGAGRRKKVRAATVLEDADVRLLVSEPVPDLIESTAQRHARLAVAALVKKLVVGANEAARIAAANVILDRGYGRPAVDVGGEMMLPFASAPAPSMGDEIRVEARKHANLAIEVLRRIAEFGQSESASVSASKSLLDRGLGTVGPARIPDDFGYRPIGKKEEAARAARTAGEGTDWGDDLRPPSTAQHVN